MSFTKDTGRNPRCNEYYQMLFVIVVIVPEVCPCVLEDTNYVTSLMVMRMVSRISQRSKDTPRFITVCDASSRLANYRILTQYP
jgi:hypothetical protein